jgi:hypothetical protein
MNEIDDMQLKAEIDNIMERVNQIMQDVGELNATPKETKEETED